MSLANDTYNILMLALFILLILDLGGIFFNAPTIILKQIINFLISYIISVVIASVR